MLAPWTPRVRVPVIFVCFFFVFFNKGGSACACESVCVRVGGHIIKRGTACTCCRFRMW